MPTRQLHADARVTRCRTAVVADDAAGEARQNPREDPAPHRPAQTESAPNMTIGSSFMRADDGTGVSATTARPGMSDAVASLYRSILWHRCGGGCQTLPPLSTQPACAAIGPLEGLYMGTHGQCEAIGQGRIIDLYQCVGHPLRRNYRTT